MNRLKRQLDTLKQNYAKSIVFAYKNRGSYEYLNFLFSASNFNDALKRMSYLKSYRQYRETEAQTIIKTQDLRQQAIISMNDSKKEQGMVLQAQSSQLKVLEEDKKEKDQVVRQLKDQEKDITAQLKKREKQRQQLNKALEAAFRRAKEEADRNAKLAKQKAIDDQKKNVAPTDNAVRTNPVVKPKSNNTGTTEATTGVITAGGASNRVYSSFESTPEGLTQSINFENNRGRLPWPVSGGLVTDRFGKQVIEGTTMHVINDGILIATPVGSSVKCVADGIVYLILDLDEYQSVLVQHGKYFTVYNKLSQTSVSKGQTIKAGTVVGKAAVDYDGGGKVEFRVMNEKNQFIDPERWLKPR